MKKGQGIKGRQQPTKKPVAQKRVAPPRSSSESSDREEVDEEEGDIQVGWHLDCNVWNLEVCFVPELALFGNHFYHI